MNTDIWKKFGKMPLEDRNKIIANVKGKSPDMSRSEIINMIVIIFISLVDFKKNIKTEISTTKYGARPIIERLSKKPDNKEYIKLILKNCFDKLKDLIKK